MQLYSTTTNVFKNLQITPTYGKWDGNPIVLILTTIVFVAASTFILSRFENKSNFSKFIMIPLIVSLLTKYILGDWDVGYVWSLLDIPYWALLIGGSYGILLYL